MKKTVIILCGLMASIFSFAGYAQGSGADSNMQILAEKIKADKKLLVAVNVGLSDAEGKTFWPIYDEYQGELALINRRTGEVIAAYAQEYNSASLTDAQAVKLLDDYLKIEKDYLDMQGNYLNRISKALSGKQAARYIQLENKIHALIRYGLAANIPLVE